MGRKDLMVKVRGFRVYLSEIDKALVSHPSIQDAATTAWDREPGEKYLAGYVVARQDARVTAIEVRQFLGKTLPDYMIPTIITFLDELPLSNGKLDRRALPRPNHRRTDLEQGYARPRNEVERILAHLWADILCLDRVGIEDNFFDLGGHSLLAVRLVSEVQKKFSTPISVTTLLKAPTVAQLAATLQKPGKVSASPLVAIQPKGSKPPFFCVHGTDGYVGLARYLGSDQPFFGLAQHLEGRKVRHTSIEDIAAYYLEEIRNVQATGPYYLGGHSIGGLIAFEMAQQLRQREQEIALLVIMDSGAPRSLFPRPGTSSIAISTRRHVFDQLKTIRWSAKQDFLKCFKIAVCQIYHYIGRPLPPDLHAFYVDQVVYGRIYAKAHRSYVPQICRCRATYLKSEDRRERVAEWRRVVPNALEVHSVPGNHFTMLSEPHLKDLAERLKACLAEAQANTKSSAQSSMSTQAYPSEETPGRLSEA